MAARGEAVVGDRGGTKQQPIGDGRQPVGGAAIDRRGTVPRAEPLQRAGQHEEPLTVVGRVLRGLHAQHLQQGERILAGLEGGAGQQHPPRPPKSVSSHRSPWSSRAPRASRPTRLAARGGQEHGRQASACDESASHGATRRLACQGRPRAERAARVQRIESSLATTPAGIGATESAA